MDEPLDMNRLGKGRVIPMEVRKVGIDAFNDLARSHDAHVKEGERLREEVKELKLRIKELEDYKVKITQQYLDLLE